MRIVLQRIKGASLRVNDELISEVKKGLMVLVGVCKDDTIEQVKKCAAKIAHMRIFERENKLNDSLLDIQGELLLVSNFTLCTGNGSGARPDFSLSADKEKAKLLYLALADELKSLGIDVKLGAFGENMQINVDLDGPITINKEIL